MSGGEVPRLVVSVYFIVAFGGFVRFLEKVARPLAEPYGCILLKVNDAELEAELLKKTGTHLEETA